MYIKELIVLASDTEFVQNEMSWLSRGSTSSRITLLRDRRMGHAKKKTQRLQGRKHDRNKWINGYEPGTRRCFPKQKELESS